MRSEHGVEVRLIRETTWQDVLDESAVDLTGQTILVTGGTTGLGKETAKALRTAGAHVLITARTPERAEGEEHVVLDLADLDRRGTHAVAVHPGMSTTELGRYMTRDDVTELMGRVKAAPGGRPEVQVDRAGGGHDRPCRGPPRAPGWGLPRGRRRQRGRRRVDQGRAVVGPPVGPDRGAPQPFPLKCGMTCSPMLRIVSSIAHWGIVPIWFRNRISSAPASISRST